MELYKNEDWKEITINSEKRNIPCDWNVSKVINKLNEFKPSKMNASEGSKSGLYPFFNASQSQTLFSNNHLVDDEAVIITTGGDYAFSQYFTGKFAYSSHVWAFKMKDDNNKFFTYLFKHFFETIQNLSVKGFKLKNLNKKDFKNIDFYFPPIEEQNDIVGVLSSQEKVIEKTKQLIKNLDKRNQFMIDELLSGRLRIKEDENGQVVFYKNEDWKTETINGEEVEIPKDWFSSNIKNEIDFFTTGSAFKTNEMLTIGKYPVVKMTDIKEGKIENGFKVFTNKLKSNALLQNGDLIIGLSGSVGKIGEVVTEQQLLLNQRCLGLRLQKNKNFIKSILMSSFKNWIFKTVKEGVIPNLSHLDVLSYEILSMKDFEKKLINKTISNIIDEKEKYEKMLKQEEKKFDFLLDELMSGRLRIRK